MTKLKFNAEVLCVSLLIAAEMLGISRGLCYRLVHDGKIPSIRLGRRILIPRAALNEMITEKRRGVEPCPDGNERPQTAMVQSSIARTDDGEHPSG